MINENPKPVRKIKKRVLGRIKTNLSSTAYPSSSRTVVKGLYKHTFINVQNKILHKFKILGCRSYQERSVFNN